MTDWFHRFTNWVSYNRFAVIGGVLGLVLTGMASCQFKAKDPVTNKPSTAAELETSRASTVRQLEIDQAKALGEYNVAAKKVQDDAARALAALQSAFNVSTAQREADLSKLNSQYENAQAEIVRKHELASGVINYVQTTLAAVNPALAGGLAGAFGLVAGGLGVDNRRKDKIIKTSHST